MRALTAAVWARHLPPTARLTLLALAAVDRRGRAELTPAALQLMTGLKEAPLRRALDLLTMAGEIRSAGVTRDGSPRYRILTPMPTAAVLEGDPGHLCDEIERRVITRKSRPEWRRLMAAGLAPLPHFVGRREGWLLGDLQRWRRFSIADTDERRARRAPARRGQRSRLPAAAAAAGR